MSNKSESRSVTGSVSIKDDVSIKLAPDTRADERERFAREDRLSQIALSRQANRINKSYAWTSFFATLLTFAGLYFIRETSLQTAETNRQARETLLATQRPWVGLDFPVSTVNAHPFLIEKGQPMKLDVNIKNFGNSPALQVRVHFFQDAITAPVNFKAIEAEINSLTSASIGSDAVLFTGQSSEIGREGPPPATDIEVDRVNQGLAMFVFRGKIQYLDQFDKPHTTTACVVYDPPKRTGGGSGYYICPLTLRAD